jgi:hypothetical protein
MSWEVLDRNELHLVRLSSKATTTPLRAKGKKSAPL